MDTVDIKIRIDLKSVRKSFVLLDLDVPSDEEIHQKMEEALVDFSGNGNQDLLQAKIVISMLAISTAYEKKQ